MKDFGWPLIVFMTAKGPKPPKSEKNAVLECNMLLNMERQ